jgi:hypothetical protein
LNKLDPISNHSKSKNNGALSAQNGKTGPGLYAVSFLHLALTEQLPIHLGPVLPSNSSIFMSKKKQLCIIATI